VPDRLQHELPLLGPDTFASLLAAYMHQSPGAPSEAPLARVDITLTTFRADDVTVVFTKLALWPQGCTFSLVATLSEQATSSSFWPHLLAEGIRSTSGSIWEAGGALFPLAATTAQGTKYPVRNANEASPPAEGLFSLGAEGYNSLWQERYWLTPLPAGSVLLTLDWEEVALAGSVVVPRSVFIIGP